VVFYPLSLVNKSFSTLNFSPITSPRYERHIHGPAKNRQGALLHEAVYDVRGRQQVAVPHEAPRRHAAHAELEWAGGLAGTYSIISLEALTYTSVKTGPTAQKRHPRAGPKISNICH
jgi:hypothetical protein